ncbi:MAG: AarF/ABC1/UbiB kinase family protein, partial [Syntrophomonadaceae bacterium]|nr:AarF/ABC1/UbiB kinase family protein [Syntrophomonadaceae bacterium]
MQQYRHIRRRQQIVGVLVKNGFGYMIQRLGLDKFAPLSGRSTLIRFQPEPDHLLAVKLRQSLVELGPTFIKLGQVMSTRTDLLPPVYIEQLELLQDKVPALKYEEIVKQLVRELGHPDEIFAEFEQEPLAAASIGQVHMARLKSGELVIVKIQRPGIEKIVQNDLEIIIALARLAERRSLEARRIGVVDMIEDYSRMFLRELDYAREARNTERVYHNFAGDRRVVIPRVYWEYTTGKILTEEHLSGVKLSNLDEIAKRSWDRRKISQLGTEAFLSQIMLHGFFQADPHPGNILVLDEERIAFIDFGEIGSLTDKRLILIGELLLSINKQDMDKAMVVLQDMGIVNVNIDIEDLQEDFADLLKSVSGNIGKLDINRLRKEMMLLAYRYQLKMPAYLTSMMKALITVEGVGKKLDPNYDFMETARPLASKIYQERLKPGNLYKMARRKYYQDIKPLGALPFNFNKLVKNTADGHLHMNIEIDLSPKAHHKISQLVSRLSASLI